ncbi:hypothetical protein KDN34_02895 [Shewanella yunxiaonensis]|uniref:Uncharacterized protein n=1 Tax=Shewanella yunxiaonensis TaxID=2829809 RepID=A0ABX7YUT5_9GAMM|nr:hypothetical protein [Shewanella yunxiaonensis]QUN06427.1 hypothetical protein KDN34_02895 [Shewanella yunxiaonensis]
MFETQKVLDEITKMYRERVAELSNAGVTDKYELEHQGLSPMKLYLRLGGEYENKEHSNLFFAALDDLFNNDIIDDASLNKRTNPRGWGRFEPHNQGQIIWEDGNFIVPILDTRINGGYHF